MAAHISALEVDLGKHSHQLPLSASLHLSHAQASGSVAELEKDVADEW